MDRVSAGQGVGLRDGDDELLVDQSAGSDAGWDVVPAANGDVRLIVQEPVDGGLGEVLAGELEG